MPSPFAKLHIVKTVLELNLACQVTLNLQYSFACSVLDRLRSETSIRHHVLLIASISPKTDLTCEITRSNVLC